MRPAEDLVMRTHSVRDWAHWAAVVVAFSALNGACLVSTDGRDPDEDAGPIDATTSSTSGSSSTGATTTSGSGTTTSAGTTASTGTTTAGPGTTGSSTGGGAGSTSTSSTT